MGKAKKSKMKIKSSKNKGISSSKLINYCSVSILMVTQRKRINFLELFTNNLFNQSKLDLVKEVIIVNGSPSELEHDELELFINSQIRFQIEERNIELKYIPTKKLNIWKKIGAYRNLANKEASSDFFLWMDDDDYYHPEYIEEALLSWKKNNYQLVGCSANYIYDYYYGKVFKCKGFGPNHSINCVLGYTKEYGKSHQYENHKERGEEKYFLDNYKNPMEQMNPKKTILQFSHGRNTFNKNKLFDTNILGNLLKKDVKIMPEDIKLESLVPENIANKYLKLFNEESERDEKVNDITLYLGSQEEFYVENFIWLEKVIEKEFPQNKIEIFGIFPKKEELETHLSNNIKLYNFDELDNKSKIKNLWLHNVTSLIPYFMVNGIKLDYENLYISVTKIDQLVIEHLIKYISISKKTWVNDKNLGELIKKPVNFINLPRKLDLIDHSWKNPNKIVIMRELDEFLLYFLEIVGNKLKEISLDHELVVLVKNEFIHQNIAQKMIPVLARPNILVKKYNNFGNVLDEIKSASIFVDLPGNPNDFEHLFLHTAIRYQTIPIIPETGSYLKYNLPNFMYDLRKPKNLIALGEMIANLYQDKKYQQVLLNKMKHSIFYN